VGGPEEEEIDQRGGWSGSSNVRSQHYTYATTPVNEDGTGGWDVAAVKQYLLHRTQHQKGEGEATHKGRKRIATASGGRGSAPVGGPDDLLIATSATS
jgi:hypothetical protein